MNRKEAIALLNDEGWTKADAKRALELLDFKLNLNFLKKLVEKDIIDSLQKT